MNKHPKWATHIMKWPGSQETMYVGPGKIQQITWDDGTPCSVDDFDSDIELVEPAYNVEYFKGYGWRAFAIKPIQMENK